MEGVTFSPFSGPKLVFFIPFFSWKFHRICYNYLCVTPIFWADLNIFLKKFFNFSKTVQRPEIIFDSFEMSWFQNKKFQNCFKTARLQNVPHHSPLGKTFDSFPYNSLHSINCDQLSYFCYFPWFQRIQLSAVRI